MVIASEIAHYRLRKNGVAHATLNPEGPGAVRIFCIPPKYRFLSRQPYVVLLNGNTVLPLGHTWALLLCAFLKALLRYEGKPMDGAEMDAVVLEAVKAVRRIYPTVKRSLLTEDMRTILAVFFDIARGEQPQIDIGELSLRAYAPHMTAPHRMDLLVSAMTDRNGNWQCNQKCVHCYAAGQPGAGAAELPTQDWKRVIDRCRAAGIPQVTFTGGEPTLRPDLAELVSHARWFVTRLNTNGVLLTKALCEDLMNAGLDSVQVTLYSHDEAIHNKLVGAPNWAKTVAGLENALAAGLDLSVNTPLCGQNRDYIATLAFLHNKGVRYVSCSGLIQTGAAAGGESLAARLGKEEITAIVTEAAAFCAGHDMEISFTSPGWIDAEILSSLGIAVPMCGACLSNMAVGPDGTVYPCQSWLSEGLGNILTDDWRKIWSLPKGRQIRGMAEEEALNCPFRSACDGGDC